MAKQAKPSPKQTEVGKAWAEEWDLATTGQFHVLEERDKRAVQERWLPILQGWHAELTNELKDEPDPEAAMDLLRRGASVAGEILRLRRALKLGPDIEGRRRATRERVARWRQRQREQHA